MTDIAFIQVPNTLSLDWLLIDGDLATGDDLASSVLVSLFTDAEAPDGFIAPDPRGWWGDVDRASPIGSKLWTLRRAKKVPDTLRKAEDYARTALRWMLEDKVAEEVTVSAYWFNQTGLALRINITQPTGKRSFDFSWAWDQIGH